MFVIVGAATFAAAAGAFVGGAALSLDDTLGNSLIHTLPINAQHPLTAEEAAAQNWTASSGRCTPSHGVHFVPPGGVSRQSPLSAYYTPGGQLCGLKIAVWGSAGAFGSAAFEGPAAPGNLTAQGFYTSTSDPEQFDMSVSLWGVRGCMR